MYGSQIAGYLLAYKIITGTKIDTGENKTETRQYRLSAQTSKEAIALAGSYFNEHGIPTDDIVSATLVKDKEKITLANNQRWLKRPKVERLEDKL